MQQLLQKRVKFSKLAATTVAAGVALLGLVLIWQVFASGPTLYLDSESQQVEQQTEVDVEVRMNTAEQPVNAVQANLSYPADKLELLNVDTSESALDVEAEETIEEGSIRIARGSVDPVTGDLLIANLTFSVMMSSTSDSATSATIAFTDGSVLMNSEDNTDILNATDDITLTTPEPEPDPLAVNITNPAENITVEGTVNITAEVSGGADVEQVDFSIDDTHHATVSDAPYEYSWDTTDGGDHPCNGAHTHDISAETSDVDGATATDTVTVNMEAPDYCITPGAVEGLQAEAIDHDTVELIWQEETESDSYEVQILQDDWTSVASDITATSYTHNGGSMFDPGAEYSYRVRGVNEAGNGDWSESVSVTIPEAEEPPAQVSGLTGEATDHQTIALEWNETEGADSYQIFVYTGRSWSTITDILETGFTWENARSDSTYTFNVRVVNQHGNGEWSEEVEVTTPVEPEPQIDAPAQVQNLQAEALDHESVALDWDGVDEAEVYEIQINTSSWGTIADNNTSTSYTHDGSGWLEPNTEYSYRVRGVNEGGSGEWSEVVSVTTLEQNDREAPSAPANLTAEFIGYERVDYIALNWDASTDDTGVEGYYVYRDDAVIATVGASDSSYSDSDIQAGASYDYYIRAFDEAGNISDASNTVTITATDSDAESTDTEDTSTETEPSLAEAPAAPTNVQADVPTNRQVNLTWDASDGGSGYYIYRDGRRIGSSSTTSFGDGTVKPNRDYTYYVTAHDSEGNESSPSSSVEVITHHRKN